MSVQDEEKVKMKGEVRNDPHTNYNPPAKLQPFTLVTVVHNHDHHNFGLKESV